MRTTMLALLSGFLIPLSPLFSCNCDEYLIDLPVSEMGLTTTNTELLGLPVDLIFNAVLQHISETFQDEEGHTRHTMTFKVLRYYKGEGPETVDVITNPGGENCGFEAKLNSKCLIFAQTDEKGRLFTFRSDCWKSIAEPEDWKRYNKYLQFLNAISLRIDGQYMFKQSRSYYNYQDTITALKFSLRDGRLDDVWELRDRKGRLLELGKYVDGQKSGEWTVVSFRESIIGSLFVDEERTDVLVYEDGEVQESYTLIETKNFDWENHKKQPKDEMYITRKREMLVDGETVEMTEFDSRGNVLQSFKR